MERAKRKHPIENHKTAAWAGIEDLDSDSKVTFPSDEQIKNAKEYADSNEK